MMKEILELLGEEMTNHPSFHQNEKKKDNLISTQQKESNLNEGQNELKEIKEWISTLSYEQFLSMLEFSFDSNHQHHKNDSVNLPTNQRNTSYPVSHDFNLMKQMCHLQVPPPTPIHPRAISFKPATLQGASDGKNEEDRKRNDRFTRPRLFQLIKRNTLFDSLDLSTNIINKNKFNIRKHKKKKNLSMRDDKKEQYDVITKRMQSPWGEQLSLGLTYEQELADRIILLETKIQKNHDGIPVHCSFSPSLSSTEALIRNMTRRKKSSDCSSSSWQKPSKTVLFEILRIASRGKFLSKCKNINENFSPWFETNEWFSLSSFIVNCFELSLWSNFENIKRRKAPSKKKFNKSVNDVSAYHHHHHHLVDIMNSLSKESIQSALLESIKFAMIKALTYNSSNLIRDNLTWDLIHKSQKQNFESSYTSSSQLLNRWRTQNSHEYVVNTISESILSIPLIEIGTSFDTFTTSIQYYLNNELAKVVEAQLLDSVKSEKQLPPLKHKKNNNESTQMIQKKKKKKKQKQKKTRIRSSIKEILHDVSKNENDSDGENFVIAQLPAQKSSKTISTQRNKNTIIVLMVIEEVIQKTFDQLGLNIYKNNEHARNVNEEKLTPKDLKKNLNAQKNISSNSSPTSEICIDRTQNKDTNIFCNNNDHIKKSKKLNAQLIEKNNFEIPNTYGNPSSDFSRKVYGHKFMDTKNDIKLDFLQSGFDTTNKQYNEIHGIHDRKRNLFFNYNDAGELSKSTSQPHYGFSTPHRDPIANRKQNSEEILFHYGAQTHLYHPLDHIGVPSYFDAATLKASGAFDGWLGVKQLQTQKSLIAELFTDDGNDRNNNIIASSTAASLASSSGDDNEKLEVCVQAQNEDLSSLKNFDEKPAEYVDNEEDSNDCIGSKSIFIPSFKSKCSSVSSICSSHHHKQLSIPSEAESTPANIETTPISTPPLSPSTPPPQLSPILISLADLPNFRKRATSVGRRTQNSNDGEETGALVAGSLPSSPIVSPCKSKDATWSHDDCRRRFFLDKKYDSAMDAKDKVKKQSRMLRKSFLQVASFSSQDLSKFTNDISPIFSSSKSKKNDDYNQKAHTNFTSNAFLENSKSALSDGDFDNRETEHSNQPKEINQTSKMKDGTSPINKSLPNEEDFNTIRDERNAYRDMCLTLGAEVAKLKNQLSCQQANTMYPMIQYPPSSMPLPSYDPEFMAPVFRGHEVAMSDAGVQRHDHDSARSDDGTDVIQGITGGVISSGLSWVSNHNVGGHKRGPHSGTGTYAGSDSSVDQRLSISSSGFRHSYKDPPWPTPFHGLQSRLSKDICNFLESISIQLNKQDVRRKSAIDRLTKMVTALWPRAQIKMYGSHVSNLCLPSSDLDFIISLPAVHKNAPAESAGVLEGRNAINETWQKLLARKLKGESWIDPRSIKLIERTVVPVIKLATKDAKSRMLQLDISFDSNDHHGLEAVEMVSEVMSELPMARPLVLVVKQFLLDRGLLTAYTGGLSSYCLFLMVTRFLQEQSSHGDCGSLLMGFLDFYGNTFDPRTTGISVTRRQYFCRNQQQNHEQQTLWGCSHKNDSNSTQHSAMSNPDVCAGKVPMNTLSSKFGMRPPRAQNRSTSTLQTYHASTSQAQHNIKFHPSGRPYTFDPLFVEDPLSPSNNVGRNAFRIHQVKRSFSDAHRALVASLEWDITSSDLDAGSEYPLLNCLLQREDVFHVLDDVRF